MTPHYVRFIAGLVLGGLSAGCTRPSPRQNEIPPPSGGPSCVCPVGSPVASTRATCGPMEADAGCHTIYTPGGPLFPPELSA